MIKDLENFDPHTLVPEWPSLSLDEKVDIIEEFSTPTSDNSVFLDSDNSVILNIDPAKSI